MPARSSSIETRVIPYIFYSDIPAALVWLTAAFGLVETLRQATPSGMHAEMTLDGQMIMMGQVDGNARMQSTREAGTSTQGIFVWIADADAHFARAQAGGAEIVHAPKDLPYGRGYSVRDLDGHPWFFTTPCAKES